MYVCVCVWGGGGGVCMHASMCGSVCVCMHLYACMNIHVYVHVHFIICLISHV